MSSHLTANCFSFSSSRGQNPLHLLGQYGKENAAAIFELFRESMPEYPVGLADHDGNTGSLKNV